MSCHKNYLMDIFLVTHIYNIIEMTTTKFSGEKTSQTSMVKATEVKPTEQTGQTTSN